MDTAQKPTGWVGWVYFAAMLMMLVGLFQAIAGLVALFKDDMYVVTQSHLLVFDYTAWGWIHLAVGVLLFLTSLSIFAGQRLGIWLGVIFVTLSAIAHFAFISAYPIWSIVVIVVDVLILFALIVHGDETKLME